MTMSNITEKQAPSQPPAQRLEADQRAGESASDGKLLPSDNDNSPTSAKALSTKTTTDDARTTTTTTTTTPVQYDVEHLATFSTASSHKQQVGAAPAATNENCNGSSKVKLKHATTNDSSRITEPREALQRLFELEKLSGIWTQRMQIELQQDFMLIVDCETNSIVERFHRDRVTKPEAFSHYNNIYNNIIVFIIDQPVDDSSEGGKMATNNRSEDCDRTMGELHIFQCVSHKATQLVGDILSWKSPGQHQQSESTNDNDKATNKPPPQAEPSNTARPDIEWNRLPGESVSDSTTEAGKPSVKGQAQEASKEVLRRSTMEDEPATTASSTNSIDNNKCKPFVTVASSAKSSETVPIVNVNVKETVQVFNQIAALREKSSAVGQSTRPLSDASGSSQSGSNQQQTPTALSEFSRAPLGPGGQSYKQRSIRATLAPKTDSKDSHRERNSKNQDQSTSSSSSITSSTERANAHNAASNPDQQSSPRNKSSKDSSSGQASSSSSSSLVAASNRHDGSSQPFGHNHGIVNNGSHTRSGSSSHHHSHGHQQQAPVKGESNKHGPASSRLPATNGNHHKSHHGGHGASLGIHSSNSSSGRSHDSPPSPPQHQHHPVDQVTSNESYVSVLNHCFDDIEKFILRIQHAYAAMRELQAKKRLTKRSAGLSSGQLNKSHPNGGPLPPLPPALSASELTMLSAQARGPSADDFFEILSKFKLAFNLLAKLKGCIHEPNAPELVHFLFTPLAIIIESARNVTPPVDPTVVGIPYLNTDALDLLSNCCTSKESDLWHSLGPNWTETIDIQLLKASRLPSSFQPIFSDGWAPVISELELIGLVVPSGLTAAFDSHHSASGQRTTSMVEESTTPTSRIVNHVQKMQDSPPLPAHSINNGALSSSSRAKRASHNGAPNPRYANPMMQSGYMEGHLTGPDGIHPADPYHTATDMQLAYNTNSLNEMHTSSRHSMPSSEKSIRNGARHLAQMAGSRRSSDYMARGQYAPPMLNGGFNGQKEDHLNGRYADYPPINPSEDYTELQNNHYLAGPSARRGDEHLNYPGVPLHPAEQPRRRAPKSSYNRQYVAEPHYEEHGHDLMVHEVEREAMLADMGPAQTEWFYELKLRGALIVRVLFTREANNDKELTVKRGEVLEILDDTRKWWKARNIDLQVAYVPHTIVAFMEHYQTLDELLTGTPGDMLMMINEDQAAIINSQRYAARESQVGEPDFPNHPYHGYVDERRNSKTSKGAFRYF